MSFRYEINTKNEIRVWDDTNSDPSGAPFFLQPCWPNGTSWATKKEADAWAKAFIAQLENPESELVAGDGPEEPTKPRPIPVEEPAAETPTVE